MTVDDLLALLSAFGSDADGDCDDDGDTDVNDLLILISLVTRPSNRPYSKDG